MRPWQTGAMSNRSGRQALDVIPCCSGPAPLTIDPKLGKVTVGITPRACRLNADSCWNDRKLGGAEDRRTLAPSPSTPRIITDLTFARGCAKADAANIAKITRRIRRYFATLQLIGCEQEFVERGRNTTFLRNGFAVRLGSCLPITSSRVFFNGLATGFTSTRSMRRTRSWSCGCGENEATTSWNARDVAENLMMPTTATNGRCEICHGAHSKRRFTSRCIGSSVRTAG